MKGLKVFKDGCPYWKDLGVGFFMGFAINILIVEFATHQGLYHLTRKYPLRKYILGLGAPGTPGSLWHMEQLLLVTFCDSPVGIGASLQTHVPTDGQTDMTLEIVF